MIMAIDWWSGNVECDCVRMLVLVCLYGNFNGGRKKAQWTLFDLWLANIIQSINRHSRYDEISLYCDYKRDIVKSGSKRTE